MNEAVTVLARRHSLPLVLAVVVTALGTGGDTVQLAWRYERADILAGEWWRLVTGNLVHLGWSHLALNLAGLALIWLLCWDRLAPGQWLLATAATTTGVGVGLLAFNPALAWYVGLSGALHGLFAAGLAAGALRRLRGDGLLLGLLGAKLIWEQWQGSTPGTAALAGGPVIVDAHLYGALAGLAVGTLVGWQARRAASVRQP